MGIPNCLEYIVSDDGYRKLFDILSRLSESKGKKRTCVLCNTTCLQLFLDDNLFQIRATRVCVLWILILLSLIVLTTVKFYKIDKIAAYLITPYILWVSFASILNYSIWQLNK